jgi:hypothetical protein
MKRTKPKPTRTRTATRRTDTQLRAFERTDLGTAITEAGGLRWVHRKTRPRSIALDDALVETLRAKGAKRGLGYQTMLKLIVREHLDEY